MGRVKELLFEPDWIGIDPGVDEMGCDIHVFCENYNQETGLWEPDLEDDDNDIRSIYVSRNYGLFGTIANVRHEYPWSLDPKGLPDDVTDPIRDYMDGDDIHSVSYIDKHELSELMTVIMLSDFFGDTDSKNYLMSGLTTMMDIAKRCDRIVFGFDN
jgi:hypothetical protein